jgi:hypothetical protein
MVYLADGRRQGLKRFALLLPGVLAAQVPSRIC